MFTFSSAQPVLVLTVICIEEGGQFSLGLEDVAHLGQVDVQLSVVV